MKMFPIMDRYIKRYCTVLSSNIDFSLIMSSPTTDSTSKPPIIPQNPNESFLLKASIAGSVCAFVSALLNGVDVTKIRMQNQSNSNVKYHGLLSGRLEYEPIYIYIYQLHCDVENSLIVIHYK